MDTTQRDKTTLALLIDADNISAKYIPVIMDEIPRYGIATYKRIYGDFTDAQMSSWRPELLKRSILPVQQFSNVKSHKKGEKAGKNATDSALIIDAMDILYAGKIDGFIIVSSDSDFTRLAVRLRESNMLVIGMGCNITAESFRMACTRFVNIENLYKDEIENYPDEHLSTKSEQKEAASKKSTKAAEKASGTKAGKKAGAKSADSAKEQENIGPSLKDVESVIAGVIRTDINAGCMTGLSQIGSALNTCFPDFDVRNFGYTQLHKMIASMERFTLTKTNTGYDVQLANTEVNAKAVAEFIIEQLKATKGKRLTLSSLSSSVRKNFPHFNYKDAGYAQFYKFIKNIDGIKITGTINKHAELEKK